MSIVYMEILWAYSDHCGASCAGRRNCDRLVDPAGYVRICLNPTSFRHEISTCSSSPGRQQEGSVCLQAMLNQDQAL